MRFHLAKQFHGLRFKTRFAGIGVRNYCLDFNSHDIPLSAHKSRSWNSFTWDSHITVL